jgi:glycosyltransferase involved in cell wall biosynthesis
MASVPAVSIVVATKDRAPRVLRLLDALADQQDAPDFDVVVVDDGSTDGTASRVTEHAAGLPYDVTVLSQERSTGPAGARNVGWRAARADRIAFTDDDCVPTPRWLATLTAALDDADVAAGPTTYPADQADRRGTWSYWMEDDGTAGQYSTCNIAYRREALAAVDGFDAEGFTALGESGARCINGEDTDLAWRAIEAGYRTTVAFDAVVHHDVFPSDWHQYVRNARRLEGLVLLIKKHPHLRAHFGREWFWNTEHAAVIAVAGALVAMTSRRMRPLATVGLVGAVAWYTRLFRRFRRPPTGRGGYVVAVPLGLIADGYATLVMARSSFRYRTLLL